MSTAPTARIDGPTGWLVASAACLLNAWSFATFYAYATAVQQVRDEFSASLSSFGFVFGLTMFGVFCCGLVTGPLVDRFGARPLVLSGSVFITAGLYLSAQATSLIGVYVTYSIGVGAGIGLYLVPITAAVSGWFDKRRASGLGLSTAGIGIGTLTVPIFERMINSIGWRSSFELMALGSLGVYLLAGVAMRPPPSRPMPNAAADRAHVVRSMRTPEFARLYFSGLAMSLALFAPFVFLYDYATERGVSGPLASALITLLGVGSVVGRLGIGPFAERVGVLPSVVLAFAVQPVAYLIWLAAGGTYGLMALFALVLGVGYGGYVALSPTAAAQCFGLQGLGRLLGVLYTSAGTGALFGPLMLGMVIEHAGYRTAILLSVGLGGLATAIAIPLWRDIRLGTRAPGHRRNGSPEPQVFAVEWVIDLDAPPPDRAEALAPGRSSSDRSPQSISGAGS